MAAKNNDPAVTGNQSETEHDSTEKKVDVVLLKPARIDGIKHMPGDTVSVNKTVFAQLDDAEAISAAETALANVE